MRQDRRGRCDRPDRLSRPVARRGYVWRLQRKCCHWRVFTQYASRGHEGRQVIMHQFILSAPEHLEADFRWRRTTYADDGGSLPASAAVPWGHSLL